MKFKPQYIYLALAVLLGLVSLAYINGVVQSARDAEQKAKLITTQSVFVASHNIAPGAVITEADVKVMEWPAKSLPAGATFNKISDVVGRVAKSEFYFNEPIYESKLSGKDSSGGLTVLIPPGMRAITIAVSEVKGVAGFVKPGDHVDVLVTFNDFTDKENRTQVTKTVLQNTLVIAAAQQATSREFKDTLDNDDQQILLKSDKKRDKSPSAQVVSSVTLALTPQDSEKLALADETGELRLALRSERDFSAPTVKLSGYKSRQLLNGTSAPTGAVYRGNGRSTARAASVYGKIVEIYDSGERSAIRF